ADEGETLRSFRQRQLLRDVGLDPAFPVHLQKILHRRRDQLGRAPRVEAPVQADDGVVLDERVVERGRRDTAGRETDNDDAALKGDAFGGTVVDVAADRVEDDVRAAAAGDGLHLFGEVVRLVVDRVVGAQLSANLQLFVGSGGGDDPGALRLAELDRSAAYAACPRVNEQRLAGLQVGSPVQAEPSRLV